MADRLRLKASRAIQISFVVALLVTACGQPAQVATPLPPPTQQAVTEIEKVTPPASAPAHRIQIRVVGGVGEFYDRVTGARFVPRGMNYVRLGPITRADGSTMFGHNQFDPGRYDSQRGRAALEQMHRDGYNVVRVFLNADAIGTETGGLSPAYMANLVDFLKIAERTQMFVIFTTDWSPGGIYGVLLNRDCCDTFALMNANFLPAGGLEANRTYFHDLAAELIRMGAPVEYVLSYQIRNEMFYDGDQPPLSFSSGVVTTANGKSYDMSDPADRSRMLDENIVYWIDSVRAGILKADPTVLVSVGFFHPQLPHRSRVGDPRLVVSEPAIWRSQADFIDLHAYPGFELDLRQHVENFGINDMQLKPIIMGEFGGEISRFDSIFAAAERFVEWQVESCRYGFDGWIFWTWDLYEQPDFFNAAMRDGAINGVLAPVNRPDPCSP